MALRFPPVHASQSRPWQACHQRGQRHFDALVFGDEPAAIMTALELKRQLVRLKHLSHPMVVIVADPDTRAALGGVLSRSGLAYLDRPKPRSVHPWISTLPPKNRHVLNVGGCWFGNPITDQVDLVRFSSWGDW
jgi:hypothetical protein